MQEHSYLLFGEERWAIAQRWIARVEALDGVNTPEPMDLSAWGIVSPQSETAGHVLCVETPAFHLSLLVYGQLKSLRVNSDQVIELPPRFFGTSPAVALICRDNDSMPALLLDPARLNSHLSGGGEP